MSYHYINVKHFKRGASWDNGQPRMCIRCRINGSRAHRAIVIAIRVDDETKRRFPVAYCQEDIPLEIG